MKKRYFTIFLLLTGLLIVLFILSQSILLGGDLTGGSFCLGLFVGGIWTWLYFKTEYIKSDEVIIWSELFKKPLK